MADIKDPPYETEDFSPAGIRRFTLGLAILTVLVFAAMAWLLWALSDRHPPGQGLVTPTAPAPDMSPAPDLQVASTRDYQALRELEEAQLRSYGWIDRDAGIVAIPIERAMELLAERGLPLHQAQGKAPRSHKAQP